MLLEIAIGDAYGAGFEFAPKEFVEEFNTLEQYVDNPKFKSNNTGLYTDDTQQSLAISELLLQHEEWTPIIIADKLVEVYKRDPRSGYGKGSRIALKQADNGQEFLDIIHGTSDRCGAAMRSMPIGILNSVWEVIGKTYIQASVTHNSDDGITSAIISSLMVHYFSHNLGDKKNLPRWLFNYVGETWLRNKWAGDIVSTNGIECVHAALTSIINNDNLSEVLKECISYSGDVDSVASIALAAASYSQEIDNNLPQVLIDNLENDTYGRDYLIKLDDRLRSVLYASN